MTFKTARRNCLFKHSHHTANKQHLTTVFACGRLTIGLCLVKYNERRSLSHFFRYTRPRLNCPIKTATDMSSICVWVIL